MRFLVILMCSCVTIGLSTEEVKPNLDTLRLVQLLFRHGDRTPTSTYPHNPYGNTSVYWPIGLGQLTDTGKRQHYAAGQYLRSRYDGFLSTTFSNEEVFVLSSWYDRAIMSVQSDLAGLFPPVNISTNWNPDIPWQPIPFRTIPKDEDNMLAFEVGCPRMEQLEGFIGPENLKTVEDTELMEYVRNNAGLPKDTSVGDILKVEDVVRIGALYNYAMPPWFTQDMFARLNKIRIENEHNKTSSPELKRLRGGPLLQTLLATMDRRVKGQDNLIKLVMLSAHDTTITRLLDTLSIPYSTWPGYASMLMVELHYSESKGYWVEFLYRNDSTKAPYQLIPSDCSFQCPLANLVDQTKNLIPNNWEVECVALSEKSNSNRLSVGVLGLIALVVLGIGASILCFAFRRGFWSANSQRKRSYASIQQDP